MSLRRFRAVFAAEFGHFFRRPLILILALIIVLTAFGLSSGQMSISSGDSSVGGTKAWITSEFAQTQMMTYLVLLYFSFFLAIAAGLTLLRDHETKADAVVLATPVTAAEYVWGRYLAVLSGFALLLLLQAGADAFWNHAVPNGAVNEIRGPFAAGSYFTPALMIGLPFLVFFGGVSLYVGERTRNAVLVYLLPVFALLFCGFFLWEWSPAWLDLRVNRLLMVLDPAGFRWLNETYLKVDRGVAFYNHAHVGYDGLFWLNRAWLLIGGLGAVFLTQRAVAASRRGAATARDRAAVRSAGAPGRGGAP
ncbi:MAG: hypothetical protein ACM3JJ_06840, partial [Hyphomicrobiales bacterium]